MTGADDDARRDRAKKPKPLPRPAGDGPALRRCLRCNNRFRSSDWGNRMCQQCKHPRKLAGY